MELQAHVLRAELSCPGQLCEQQLRRGRGDRRCFAALAADRTESFVEADTLRAACLRQESEDAAIHIHTEERKVTAPNM